MYYFIISFLLILILGYLIVNKFVLKNKNEKLEKIAKISIIVYMVLEFITLFIPDTLSYRYTNEELANLNYSYIALIRWFNEVAFVVVPFAIFFKNKPMLTKIVAYFVLPVALIYIYSISKMIPTWMDGEYANGIGKCRYFGEGLQNLLTNVTFRTILFGLMGLVEIFSIGYIVVSKTEDLKFKSVKEVLLTLLQLIFLIVTVLPIWTSQHIFGTRSEIYMKPYKLYHLLWVVEIIIEVIFVSIFCKKLDYESKYILVFTLTLTLTLQYHQMFNMLGEIDAHRFPLQLCNIASYLLIITLLTKNNKIYHFTLVANVFGAICAIALLNNDSGDGLLQPMNWHYIMEHQNVIVAPLLMLTLRLFKPLEKKDYLDIVKYWSIYFVIVLVLGITFNGIKDYLNANGSSNGEFWNCNYFFMFDPSTAAEFLPFTVPLFNIELTIFKYWHIKLIQPIMYVAFLAFFAIVYYIMYFTSSKKHKKELGLIK